MKDRTPSLTSEDQGNLPAPSLPLDPSLLLEGPRSLELPPELIDTYRKSARNKVTLLTDKAVRTLDKGLDSKDLKVAISAAKEILDRDGISPPKSLLLDDTSGFSSSVVLGLLAGAAKVMGLPVDDSLVQRTLMEAKVSPSEATLTMATETSFRGPKPEAPPSPPQKNITPRKERKKKVPTFPPPSSLTDSDFPSELLSAIAQGNTK